MLGGVFEPGGDTILEALTFPSTDFASDLPAVLAAESDSWMLSPIAAKYPQDSQGPSDIDSKSPETGRLHATGLEAATDRKGDVLAAD